MRVGFNFAARASRSAFDSDRADVRVLTFAGAKADALAKAEMKRASFILSMSMCVFVLLIIAKINRCQDQVLRPHELEGKT